MTKILLSIIAALAGANSAATLDSTTSSEPAIEARVFPIDMLPGVAQPARSAQLSTSVIGIVREVVVEPGDQVVIGQPLIVLDDRVAIAALQVAKQQANEFADRDSAQAALNVAQQYEQRILAAHATDAASDFELEQARAKVAEAFAMVRAAFEAHEYAIAQVELEQAKLASHRVEAPFDGEVIRVTIGPGEKTTIDAGIIHVADLSDLHLELHVPVEFFKRLEAGAVYQIAAQAPVNEILSAELIQREPMIDPGTQTFRCVFRIDNHQQELPAGFLARLCWPSDSAESR